MSNNTERLVNHQDAIDLGAKLDGIKNAILGTAGNGESTMSMAKILANIRNGGGPTNLPVGAELTFSESPSLSMIIAGNTVENVTTGITSESVDLATFISKIGTSAGVTTQFIYYGGAWHKDSITGDVVTLSAYGVTFTGTPKANDFITVALATSDFVMQVAAYDHYTLKNSAIVHHAVLVAKNCVRGSQQFDNNPELSFANTKKIIPAGKYKFECYKAEYDQNNVYDGEYVFTTTQAIPLNGGFFHTKIGNDISWGGGTSTDPTSGTITTYAADHSTVIESGIAVTAYNSSTDADAVDLGTMSSEYFTGKTYSNEYGFMNFTRRKPYGTNDWASSIYRQWLNATTAKGTWWKQLGIFKMKPANAWVDQVNGYGYQMDTDLMGAIQKTKVNYYMCDSDYNLMTALSLSVPPCYLNVPGVTINGRIITVEDYFFPLSIKEVGLGDNYNDNLANNTVLDLYSKYTNADRIKYYSGSAKYVWLRSPILWTCSFVAYVSPTGALYDSCASYAYGVVPACCIG